MVADMEVDMVSDMEVDTILTGFHNIDFKHNKTKNVFSSSFIEGDFLYSTVTGKSRCVGKQRLRQKLYRTSEGAGDNALCFWEEERRVCRRFRGYLSFNSSCKMSYSACEDI